MDTYYKLASIYNGEEGAKEEISRNFKGETEISIDLSDAAEGDYYIVKIIVDFNDGTPLHIREYDVTDHKKITRDYIKHKYYPSNEYDFKFYYPTIYVTYSNFKQFIYQIPIKILKESFFSSYKNIEIDSCQFVDDENDSVFVNFSDSNGDILRLKIK